MCAYRPNSSRLAALDEVEIEVEKLVQGGDGFARCDGLPVFVARVAPGDRARVRITERKPDYARAELVELLEGGPDRREAPCPHYTRCGGCDLQHITDEAQLRLKVSAALETLERLGGVRVENPAVHAASSWGYRSRAQLQVRSDGDRPRVGFHGAGSHDLVAVDRCPVLAEPLERLLPKLPEVLGEIASVPARLDLATADGTVVAAPPTPGLGSGDLEVQILGSTFFYDARCFFQVNLELLPQLVEVAVGSWCGQKAVDLFAGVGVFSLPLSKNYDRVTAVESDGVAVRFGRRNVRVNRARGVEYVGLRVESAIEVLQGKIDRVLVDPPRRGLPRRVCEALLEAAPERLTYVSCQPATLARDLRQLTTAYEVEKVDIFDLFPQTGHLETVVQLVLSKDTRRQDDVEPSGE